MSDMGRTPPTSRQLAEVINAAIEDAGLSERQVALRAGLTTSTLNRRLNTDAHVVSPFIYEELAAVAHVLDIPVSQLIERAECMAAVVAV